MKKIENLENKMKEYTGKEIEGGSIKDALLNVIGSSKQPSGRDTLKIHRVAMKIMEAKGSVELEDYDFELVKKAVEESGYLTLIKAQLLGVLGEKGE